jgi:hypothetical protein
LKRIPHNMALFLGLCFLQGSHVLMSLAPSGSESLALKRDPYTKPSIEEASSTPTLVSYLWERVG